jgi:DNA-binding response OmpR family regulator/signal transduction histidine kinase
MVGIAETDALARVGADGIRGNGSAAIFLVDSDGTVVYANEQLARLTDLSLQVIIGRSYAILVNRIAEMSDPNVDLKQWFAEALEQLEWARPISITANRPVPRQLQLEFFPIHPRTPDVAWGSIIHDLTSAQDFQARQYNALLAFVHEIRSALVSVMGHIALLNGESYPWGDQERQDFLGKVNGQVQRLIWLLAIVRDASQIEANTLPLDRQPTDLKQIILRVARRLSEEVPDLDLALDIPEDLPTVAVDVLRVGRALHILMNSVLALAAGDQVKVVVRQIGEQIQMSLIYQESTLAARFEEGQFSDLLQARSLVSSSSHDLELGLYVARSIFWAHGGYVTVKYQSETQIVLHLTLPCMRSNGHTANLSPRDPGEKTGLPPVVAQPARPRAKILLVEDDRQLCRFLKIQLELIGYQIIVTGEGQMALELVALEVPDLILLDLSLPDSSGLDVCRELREFTSVPIIIITGNANEEDMVRSLNLGADDYLLKPVRPKVLLARIQANLRRSYITDTSEQSLGDPVFTVGDLEINFSQRQVSRAGKPMKLTPVEHKIMFHLAVNAGRILTHDQLIAKVWGPMFRQETQYLWVNISRLRAKIEDDPHQPKYILTERGVGYYMPCPSDFDTEPS